MEWQQDVAMVESPSESNRVKVCGPAGGRIWNYPSNRNNRNMGKVRQNWQVERNTTLGITFDTNIRTVILRLFNSTRLLNSMRAALTNDAILQWQNPN